MVGEFASVGAAANGSDSQNLDAPLGPISTADGDLPHIRYTSSGTYEVDVKGGTWEQLTLYGDGPAGPILNNGNDSGGIFLFTSGSMDAGYKYSELASFFSADSNQIGAIAFGSLTPAGGVPTSGSATYNGTVMGKSDVIASDPLDGPYRADASGTVSLDFNFASGSLGGSMTVTLNEDAGSALSLGTFDFKDTVFSVGSTSYSGKFDSSTAGQNFFLGRFTGPNAEETIGAWALPFMLDTGNGTIQADHQAHQLFGAWIAKKP